MDPLHTQGRRRLSTLVGVVARYWRKTVDRRLQPFDLTEASWTPLVHLARAAEPMRQKDLAAALSVDSSAVVRVLSNLESLGLVERGEAKDDRRARALVVTPVGQALVLKVEDVADSLETELLAGLAPNEVAIARKVLERLEALLIEADDKP